MLGQVGLVIIFHGEFLRPTKAHVFTEMCETRILPWIGRGSGIDPRGSAKGTAEGVVHQDDRHAVGETQCAEFAPVQMTLDWRRQDLKLVLHGLVCCRSMVVVVGMFNIVH